jgi:ubiquinone/menaquinone biosynthesis C-methylase UbiE
MQHQWDAFFEEKIKKIFTDKKYIVDIGGGLRIDPKRNNRKKEHTWLDPYLSSVDYKILDKVPDYNPDIVGDVHQLPLADNSVDAVLCMHLLEHVEEPHTAIKEVYRVLKPGGYLYIDVPFLFYYHPMEGYYKDYYRFTKDGLAYLTRDFSSVEIQGVHGAIATVMNLFPFFSKKTALFDTLDRFLKKDTNHSNQNSMYRVFCVK